jgi:hypothetical protein
VRSLIERNVITLFVSTPFALHTGTLLVWAGRDCRKLLKVSCNVSVAMATICIRSFRHIDEDNGGYCCSSMVFDN